MGPTEKHQNAEQNNFQWNPNIYFKLKTQFFNNLYKCTHISFRPYNEYVCKM